MSQLICEYFEAGRCRSCALIETPYDTQLRMKQERCESLLTSVSEEAWLPAIGGGQRDFRNKAKLVVGGEAGRVTLGIMGPGGVGVDLRECLIQSAGIRAVIPLIAVFLESTGLAPYDVPGRKGELKFVHVTESPGGDLMLRFVVRSEHALGQLRNRLQNLRDAIPQATVISVNLLPEHKAVLEGEREVMLVGSSLDMDLGQVSLHLQPRSFFQTNTQVARHLYAQAADWVNLVDPTSLWDLYCGVGGFALHCASREAANRVASDGQREVLGVEVSESAVESARRSAREAGIEAQFVAADATQFALESVPASLPGLVIVNPPRRGIGADLADWCERSGIEHVIYSSCNPQSLAKDLALMPSLAVREARVFDMFPHTSHLEVAVLLERR